MQTLVHIKAMEISRVGIVQTKGLEVPFFWFVWVFTPSNMLLLESDGHLIYVKILTTNEIACIHFRKMIEEGFHTRQKQSSFRLFFISAGNISLVLTTCKHFFNFSNRSLVKQFFTNGSVNRASLLQ